MLNVSPRDAWRSQTTPHPPSTSLKRSKNKTWPRGDLFRDLCYLHGFVKRGDGKNESEKFIAFTADEATPELEEAAFASAWRFVHEYGDALVYYYSPYERTTWKKLARQYPEVASEDDVIALFAQPRFIDLYNDIVRSKMIWATSSLSIKALAKFLGFQWRDTDPSGAASVQWFHQWVETGDANIWARILEYNEDDCRAMRVLADGLRKLGGEMAKQKPPSGD